MPQKEGELQKVSQSESFMIEIVDKGTQESVEEVECSTHIVPRIGEKVGVSEGRIYGTSLDEAEAEAEFPDEVYLVRDIVYDYVEMNNEIEGSDVDAGTEVHIELHVSKLESLVDGSDEE